MRVEFYFCIGMRWDGIAGSHRMQGGDESSDNAGNSTATRQKNMVVG